MLIEESIAYLDKWISPQQRSKVVPELQLAAAAGTPRSRKLATAVITAIIINHFPLKISDKWSQGLKVQL